MSDSVFRRVHRIRKTEEHRARQAHRQAHDVQASCEAQVVQLHEAMEQSHASGQGHAGWLAHHHSYVLRAEMSRRTAESALQQANTAVLAARTEVVSRSVDARTVELLAESLEEQIEREHRQAEQRDLDEVGTQRFARQAS